MKMRCSFDKSKKINSESFLKGLKKYKSSLKWFRSFPQGSSERGKIQEGVTKCLVAFRAPFLANLYGPDFGLLERDRPVTSLKDIKWGVRGDGNNDADYHFRYSHNGLSKDVLGSSKLKHPNGASAKQHLKGHKDGDGAEFFLQDWDKCLEGDFLSGSECLQMFDKEIFPLWEDLNFDINPINELLLSRQDLVLYPHQRESIDDIKKAYRTALPCFGVFHKPRSGKSLTTLKFLEEEKQSLLGTINILTTSFPIVLDQWIDDSQSFSCFKDCFNFINIMKGDKIEIADNKINIVCCSMQDIKGNQKFGKGIDKNKFKILKDRQIEIMIVDEVHIGHETPLWYKNAIAPLNPKFTLGLSATPTRNLALGSFTLDNAHTWSLVDEARAKKQDPLGPYAKFPTLNHLIYSIPDKCMKGFKKEDNFTFKKWFEVQNESFVYEQEIRHFFKHILGIGPNRKKSLCNQFRPEQMLIFIPNGGIVQELFVKLLKEVSDLYPGKIKIHYTNSNLNDAKTLSSKVKGEYLKKDKEALSIIVAVQQLTTGITLRDCDMVIQLNDRESVDYYVQSGYRAQNPKKGKTECYHVDFRPSRALVAIDEAIQQECEFLKKTRDEVFREYLENVPIFAEIDSKGQLQKIKTLKLFDELLTKHDIYDARIRRVSNSWTPNAAFFERWKHLKPKVCSRATPLPTTKLGNDQHEGGLNHSVGAALTSLSSPQSCGGKKPKLLFQEEWFRNLQTFVLKLFPLYSEFKIDDWDTLVKSMAKEKRIWIEEAANGLIENTDYKLDFDAVVKELKNEIGTKVLNEFLRGNNKSWRDGDIQRIMKFYHNKIDAKVFGAVFTERTLINLMMDHVPDSQWIDPNAKWIDPACGSGNFLVYFRDRLMKSLVAWEPDENLRRKHILENMIYGVELQHKHHFSCCLILDPKREFNLNIVCGDSLKTEWDFKFDVVGGNPPFQEPSESKKKSSKSRGQKALWTDFVDLAFNNLLKINGYLVFVNPNNWVRSTNYLSKVFSNKNLIYANIASKEIGKKYFSGIGSSFSWYIVENCLKKQEPIFEVSDGYLANNPLKSELIPMKDMEHQMAYSIFEKVTKSSDTDAKEWTRKDEKGIKILKNKDSIHKYEFLYSPKKRRWADRKGSSSGVHKVVLWRASAGDAFYDYTCSTTEMVYYTKFDNKKCANDFLQVINSPLYKFLIKNIKAGGALGSAINKLPFPTHPQSNLYKFYNLSEDEVKFVESSQPKKRK